MHNTQAQREALKALWPEIGAWCELQGLTRERLMAPRYPGVPADGRKLAALRGSELLTLREFASRVGVTADMLGKIENGHRSPSPVTLLAITRAFGVRPLDLLPDEARAVQAQAKRRERARAASRARRQAVS